MREGWGGGVGVGLGEVKSFQEVINPTPLEKKILHRHSTAVLSDYTMKNYTERHIGLHNYDKYKSGYF